MNIDQTVRQLISEGYLTLVSGEITVTNKLKREYGTNRTVDISKLTGDELYYQFVTDAEVPTFLPLGGSGQQYKVRQKSDTLKKNLKKSLKTVDYKDLVEATKRYYKSSQSNKLTLNNYFKSDAWEEAVLSLLNGDAPKISDGSNKFES